MLIKMLPEQISKFWDVIKYGVEQSLPPIAGEHPDKINRILSAALSGSVDVWASYVKDDGNRILEGIVLTRILYDGVSGTKNLLIYTVYGYNAVDDESYMKIFTTLVKYAKAKGCLQLVGYTTLSYLADICKEFGADTSYTFVSFDINQIVEKLNELNGG